MIPLLLLGCTPVSDASQLITLQNEHLKVTVNRIGAELISIQHLYDEVEYLWQGDSITWSDYAIVQFPVTGTEKDGNYPHDDLSYDILSHGFARTSEFEVMAGADDRVTFQLESNEKTRSIYPFEFMLSITYQLEKNTIRVYFEVENTDDDSLYFALGYHPGFNYPLKIGNNIEDYYLEFSDPESVDRLVIEDGLIDLVHTDFLSNESKIPLAENIFQQDAIILKGIKSNSISLKNRTNNKSITVNFGQVPYLGIWSPKKFSDFVCIEPWLGIPARYNASGVIREKEGIIKLENNKTYAWDCSILIN